MSELPGFGNARFVTGFGQNVEVLFLLLLILRLRVLNARFFGHCADAESPRQLPLTTST